MELVERSRNLIVKPPIATNSISTFDQHQIQQDAQASRIVVHRDFPSLVQKFLVHKRKHGSDVEKRLYSSRVTWRDEVTRLISKRPLVFMGSSDFTVLRDGTRLSGNATAQWDVVGSDHEGQLHLDDYLSYDEIMLSSLLGVSGPSHFINNGNRFNRGKRGSPGTFEERGVIVGLVGARFEREDRMDSTFILPPVKRPRMHPELRRIFENFFGVPRDENAVFDIAMYKARMRVTIDILLLEANTRAIDVGRKAYVYIVGLGLGVWQYDQRQAEYYVTTFIEAFRELEELDHIATAEFAYIEVPEKVQESIRRAGEGRGIRVLFSKRNPTEKLETDQLLVLSYAWDGNAFPGNEYWSGSLSGSGDPAAACMSTIGELHNPLVNPGFLDRVHVCGQ